MGSKSTSPYSISLKLPDTLAPLSELALDLFWTWSHSGDRLWQALDREMWEKTRNPWIILQELSQNRLREMAVDEAFLAEMHNVIKQRRRYLERRTWYEESHSGSRLGTVAYFSMEFGLGEAMPLYAGGLGILAGDYLKTASDLGVPVVGVGLLYQEGYFRQFLDAEGAQQEIYTYTPPTSLPVQPVVAPDGGWLRIQLELPGRRLSLRVWRASVGRTELFLLDSNDPVNNPRDRGITAKLYGGGDELRFLQAFVLGVGGMRVLEALGKKVDICHLNESNTAFAALEHIRSISIDKSLSFAEARWAARASIIFTTHTPVAAGFEVFPASIVEKYCISFCSKEQCNLSPSSILALARENPADDREAFNMAFLAMRCSRAANGVSKLHGKTSRGIFQPLFRRWPRHEVPVNHVTNGVHMPTWDSAWADELWTNGCGKERWLKGANNPICDMNEFADEHIWNMRSRQRLDLIKGIRRRLSASASHRGIASARIHEAQHVLDPNSLILGIARRFTEYKRPNLLLYDQKRLLRLIGDRDRPVSLVVAGKAHPLDEFGKRLVQEWTHFIEHHDVHGRVVFLEDYDMELAKLLVRGVDVWINTPRRPWEACGTSGMKVLVNGGLNFSVLDGWWAEAWQPEFGWKIDDGVEAPDPGLDIQDANELYDVLEQKIIPEFYHRDPNGLPVNWLARIRSSMTELTPRFAGSRMMVDYLKRFYLPASKEFAHRMEEKGEQARKLAVWYKKLEEHWDQLHLGKMDTDRKGDQWLVRVPVYLGEIEPQWIGVELYADRDGESDAFLMPMRQVEAIPGSINGFIYELSVLADRSASDFTPRIVPVHPHVAVPMEVGLIRWPQS